MSEPSFSDLPPQYVYGIEYHGSAGSSRECEEAVFRLLQCDIKFKHARIITHKNCHCFVLFTEGGDEIAIKSGFSSGYGGTGPIAFSGVIATLLAMSISIDECKVDDNFMHRLDNSSLTQFDLEFLRKYSSPRAHHWGRYLLDRHIGRGKQEIVWQRFPPVMPFSLIDSRIIDLAITFRENPDWSLFQGYRRLEDIVRDRSGIIDSGTRLFSRVFQGKDFILTWSTPDEQECTGRANLFTAAYMSFRNPRAHREIRGDIDPLSEFLILNQLFLLEGQSVQRAAPETVQPA